MSRYEANPNNSKKQQPKAIPVSAHGRSVNPGAEVFTDRPNYILVNVNGTYAFAYESGSVGTYETGSLLGNAAGGPIRLDINPVAWRQTDATGTVGDITFVYIGNVG